MIFGGTAKKSESGDETKSESLMIFGGTAHNHQAPNIPRRRVVFGKKNETRAIVIAQNYYMP